MFDAEILSRFVRGALRAYNPWVPSGGFYSQRALPETPIERIYREVTGRKIPPAIKKVLIPKIGKVSLHGK